MDSVVMCAVSSAGMLFVCCRSVRICDCGGGWFVLGGGGSGSCIVEGCCVVVAAALDRVGAVAEVVAAVVVLPRRPAVRFVSIPSIDY